MVFNSIQIYFYAKIMFKIAIGSHNRITVSVLNLFHPRVDEPICYTLFTFKFEFRGYIINIKVICIDQFADLSNPCFEA